MGLEDEHVGPADGLAEAGADLPVGEVDHLAGPDVHAQVRGDVTGQRRVRAPGVELEPMFRDQFHWVPPLPG